jgi:hypothetical protein
MADVVAAVATPACVDAGGTKLAAGPPLPSRRMGMM